jgi:hypothetical protein
LLEARCAILECEPGALSRIAVQSTVVRRYLL